MLVGLLNASPAMYSCEYTPSHFHVLKYVIQDLKKGQFHTKRLI